MGPLEVQVPASWIVLQGAELAAEARIRAIVREELARAGRGRVSAIEYGNACSFLAEKLPGPEDYSKSLVKKITEYGEQERETGRQDERKRIVKEIEEAGS